MGGHLRAPAARLSAEDNQRVGSVSNPREATELHYTPRVDPEEKRRTELALAVRNGVATDAEKEELALYGEDDPEIQALVKQVEDDREIGGTWLARAEADRRLVAEENSPITRAEQRVGVGLMVGGGIAGFFFPPALLVMLVGAGVLTLSVLRVKLKTAGDDPYDDVEQ